MKLNISIKRFILLFLISVPSVLMAQKPIVVNLWPDGVSEENGLKGDEVRTAPNFIVNISKASMTVYPSSKPGSKAIIMCPGGGYMGECVTYEGHDMASWMNANDVTFIVLKYRLPNEHYNIPLADVHQAIRLARQNCKAWNINPHEVGIMGASAGGHLAATSANMYDNDTRPDFQILLYPVITMRNYTHMGSRENLLGKLPMNDLIEKYSMELQVTNNTPRAFIVLSSDDDVVPPANSINYFTALLKHHVSVTMHIYPTGGHGFGFQDNFAFKRQWTEELEKWLRTF